MIKNGHWFSHVKIICWFVTYKQKNRETCRYFNNRTISAAGYMFSNINLIYLQFYNIILLVLKNNIKIKKIPLFIMILASSLGFIDLPFRLPNNFLTKPALLAVQSVVIRNPYFREREDTETHYIGYGENQRIVYRSGSI